MKKTLSFACALITLFFLIAQSAYPAIGDSRVCKWKGGKLGAFSLGYDDALISQADVAVPAMTARGITGTFYTIEGSNRPVHCRIPLWEVLFSEYGFQIGDHTINHLYNTSSNPAGGMNDTNADYEIGACAQIIWGLMTPGASRLNIVSCPSDWSGQNVSPSVKDTISVKYSIVRESLFGNYPGMDNLYGPSDDRGNTSNMPSWVTDAVTNGHWNAAYFHGVGSNAEYITTNLAAFTSLLDAMAAAKDTTLWVGTYIDVYKYKYEYNVYTLNTVSASTSSITLVFVSTYDPTLYSEPLQPYIAPGFTTPPFDATLYDEPLSIVTEVPMSWTYCKVSQPGVDAKKIYSVTSWVSSATAMIEAVPYRGNITVVPSVMDVTPPTTPIVRDGTGADVNIITDLNVISANWTPSVDAESGIAKYWYRVGTTKGGKELLDWVDNGTFTYVTTSRGAIALSRGTTYYVAVKAVNGAGLESALGISDGQMVAVTPGYIKFSDDFETGNFSKWSGPTMSGNNTIIVSTVSAQAGTYGVKCHIQDKNNAVIDANNVTALNDVFVQFNIKFVNINMPLITVSSNCFVPFKVTTAGNAFVAEMMVGRVYNGLNIYMQFKDDTGWQCFPYWPAVNSAYMPVSTGTWHRIDFHIKADPTQGAMEMWLDGANVYSNQRMTFTNGAIRNIEIGASSIGDNTSGDVYFDNVKVSDSFLYVPSTTSAAADTTPPTAPAAVRDGTGSDISETNSAAQLSANWDASTDPESGIADYFYAIGTTAGGTDIVAWTDNGTATSVTKTGLSLTAGHTYYFSVKAENGASLTGTATNSNGQMVSPNAPAPVPVLPPAYPNVYKLSGTAPMKFSITNTSGADVKIYTMSGRLVRKLAIPSGSSTINWDGTNDSGEKVRIGLYIAKVKDGAGATRTSKIALVR